MRNWVIRWVVSGLALAIVAHLGIGVTCDSTSALVVATVVIGLVNSLIRPILDVLTAPINCLTFGLMGFVTNAFLFLVVGQVVDGFHVNGPVAALFGSILMGALSGILGHLLTDSNRSRR